MIGELLDERYRILRRLGGGGMGDVYLAEHIALGRLEALKVVKPELASDPSFIARFRREARANNRVVHPNIVGVHDFGRLPDGRFYLSTEYTEGKSLADVLDDERSLSIPRTLHIVRQLADAVAHAHEQGVIHRDLKPENLLLTTHRGQADVVKVLDFGIAKIVAPGFRETIGLSVNGEVFGTPPYMAPEQISGGGMDGRIDLYAIGCIAYELVVGETPFVGRPMEVMHKHVNATPVPPSERVGRSVPRELDEVILRLLAKAPADRYQTGRELLQALAAIPNTEAPARRTFAASSDNEDVTSLEVALPAVTEPEEALADVAGRFAEALLESGESDLKLLTSASWLSQLVEERRLVEGERRTLERITDDSERWARAHDATLRFSAAELRAARDEAKQRGEGVPSEVEVRIKTIDARVLADHAKAEHEQRQLEERGIELAARAAHLDEQLALRSREVAERALGLASKHASRELERLAALLRDKLSEL